MKQEMPWIAVLCIAHRLELAIQDALKDIFFEEVEDIIVKIYYLYQKSPKN